MEKEEEYKYITFYIPKRNGKKRKIEAPNEALKKKQRELLKEFSKNKIFKPSIFSYAFIKNRNIVMCAKQHTNKKIVMTIDIKDFFNSITYDNFIKELDIKDESLKEKLKLCFKKDNKNNYYLPNTKDEKLKEKIKLYFKKDNKNNYYLPQGAPTSPLLSNAFLKKFDYQIGYLGYKHNFVYTRYADDLIFSFDNEKLIKYIKRVVEAKLKKLGLKINKKKIRVMKQGNRQIVLGLLVNKKVNLTKKRRKILRAIRYKYREYNNEQKGQFNFEKSVYNEKRETINNIEFFSAKEVLKAL